MISWLTTVILVVSIVAAIIAPIVLFYLLYRSVRGLMSQLKSSFEMVLQPFSELSDRWGVLAENTDFEGEGAGPSLEKENWHRPGLLVPGQITAARAKREEIAQNRWCKRQQRLLKARQRWNSYGL